LIKTFSVKIEMSKKIETEAQKMASANPNLKQGEKVLTVNQAFVDNLEENVTCSKCKKVSRNATVSWCSAHHLMCQSCYDSMEAKPVQCGAACKVEYKPALSPFVANVLKMFLTKCKFAHNGCQGIMLLKELEIHEIDCAYRYINCPFLNCKDKEVTFIGLAEHLEANHGNMKKIGESKSKDFVTLPDPEDPVAPEWIPQELTFRNRSFFTEVCPDAALQARYIWIYFQGTPEEADHYTYHINIYGRNSCFQLAFLSSVYSLDESKVTLMPKEDIFILSDVQAKRLQVDGQINFEIKLYSDKEEFKNEDVESGISDNDDEQYMSPNKSLSQE
jgi:hypothetical protein